MYRKDREADKQVRIRDRDYMRREFNNIRLASSQRDYPSICSKDSFFSIHSILSSHPMTSKSVCWVGKEITVE